MDPDLSGYFAGSNGMLSQSGAFGKSEGTKVTSEKVQKRTITEIVNASGKFILR